MELSAMGRHLRTILVGLSVWYASTSFSYPTPVDFDGSLLRWNIERNDPAITFEVTSDALEDVSYYEQAVIEAAFQWNDVSGSYFAFALAGQEETAQVTVRIEPNLGNIAYSAGYAVFDQMSDQGEPEHCEIVIALDAHATYISFAKTAMHELGHCVGLGHSLVPEAIMGYQLEKNDFALDIDDQAAISRLYPADGSKPQVAPGCAVGFSHKKSMTTLWLVIMLSMPFVVRRLRLANL